MSKLQVPKRAEYIDQSSPFSKPSIYEYRTLIDISNSSQSESSEGCNRRSSDESTAGSNLSETIIHKCKRYLNVSNGSSSEFNSSESYISQNAKRIRLK